MITSTLNGLVLAGGKSLRMGKDKGQISYHGVPQSIFLYRLLDPICEQVFLSIRSDQLDQYDNSYRIIVDQDQYRGPFYGLLSAHRQDPEAAWLAVACDVPLIDRESPELLINERDQTRAATALGSGCQDDPRLHNRCLHGQLPRTSSVRADSLLRLSRELPNLR